MANMFDENGNYNKTEWKPGDRITAGKLNKIEESLETINNNDISRHVEADTRLDILEYNEEVMEERVEELEDLVADNKSEVDTAIYEVHSKMNRLEQEMNEGIEEVHSVAETVDGKIATAEANMTTQVNTAKDEMAAQVNTAKEEMTAQVNTAEANMTAQVNQGKADMEAMVAEVDDEIEGLKTADESLSNRINECLPLSGGAITGGINIYNDDYQLSLANNHLACETNPLYLRGGTEFSGIWINSNDKTIYPNREKGEWILGTGDDKWYNIYCYHAIMFSSDCSIGVGSGSMFISLHDGTREIYFQDDASSDYPTFRPTGQDIRLGHESHRWNTVYTANAVNVSSDRSLKDNIQYIKNDDNLSYNDMYNFVKDDLELARYNLIGDEKEQMNFIAQDLLYNLDGTDNKVGQMIVKPVPVPTEEEVQKGKPYPTLSYDTGIYTSILAGALKEAINKIEQLEARIQELENK